MFKLFVFIFSAILFLGCSQKTITTTSNSDWNFNNFETNGFDEIKISKREIRKRERANRKITGWESHNVEDDRFEINNSLDKKNTKKIRTKRQK